jgi:hypothetical protein
LLSLVEIVACRYYPLPSNPTNQGLDKQTAKQAAIYVAKVRVKQSARANKTHKMVPLTFRNSHPADCACLSFAL